jgi:hypothetical protein
MCYQALQRQLGTTILRFLARTLSVAYLAIRQVKKQGQAGAEHCNNSTAKRQG